LMKEHKIMNPRMGNDKSMARGPLQWKLAMMGYYMS
jgi:hypothetical protein